MRGFDEELEHRLRDLARKEGISLNKAAMRLLRRGAGLDEKGRRTDVVGASLDHLIGKWSAKDEREFLKSLDIFERIDKRLWR